MIPILYEKDENAFVSNGLGRLRDCISCVVTEERNGIYECDFEYPVTGAHYDEITLGRTVGVVTDDTNDFQPFDIVSFSKPIDGVVTFHCVHISYRQSYLTATGSNINSLADAFTMLGTAEPSNPFTYWTDKTSTGYMAAADGTPRSVRQMLGGVEGSILDAYGGEYEWDRWTVILHSNRGTNRDFAIRYGVNMLDYNEDYDSQGTYSSCVPYWTDGENTVIGDRQDSPSSTVTGRGECVPLDVSEKFEDQPTKAQVEAMGLSMLTGQNTTLPTQNIHVEFVRLQDLGYENLGNLMQCKLCDTINVIFPDYNASGRFKIVKTVWNVLSDRYDSMELGDLSTSLSEALGISNGLNNSSGGGGTQPADDYVVEHGTDGIWTYRKWNSGIAECWGTRTEHPNFTQSFGSVYLASSGAFTFTFPTSLFISVPNVTGAIDLKGGVGGVTVQTLTASGLNLYAFSAASYNATTRDILLMISAKGRWK